MCMDKTVAHLFKHFKMKKIILRKISVISMFFMVLVLTFLVSYKRCSISLIGISRRSSDLQLFKCNQALSGSRFLWYAPHSGFSNQLSEFKNAILIASILNRTLVVPPVLDHHAVALGSCPKFRVLEPSKLRLAVWVHAVELIKSGRYVAISDIVDVSPLLSRVRFIDLRDFTHHFCGLPPSFPCLLQGAPERSLTVRLEECGDVLSGIVAGPIGCVHASDADCRTVVWTHGEGDGALDPFQSDGRRKRAEYVRRRRDTSAALGPGSAAESSPVLALGSLFSAPYRGSELHVSLGGAPDGVLTQRLRFAPGIVRAGEGFAAAIGRPFFCAQVRVSDGGFRSRRRATFSGLRRALEQAAEGGARLPAPVFLMTDLPEGNWSGTYLQRLVEDTGTYDVRTLRADDPVVVRAAAEVGTGPGRVTEETVRCGAHVLPDVLLYVQEVVCGCAALGFYGTPGSTIAETVETFRRGNRTCLPAHSSR